jgi:DNA-binding CsgD family transcriptional regulator
MRNHLDHRGGRPLPRPSLTLSKWLVEALRHSSFGLAIYDRKLRVVAVNEAVAAMDHVPVEEHIGRHTSDIVGSISRIIDPRVERVFRTGTPLHCYELSAKLPTRNDVSYWLEDFIPITDNRGRVGEVGVIAVEITEQKRLEAIMRHLRRSVRAGVKISDERTLLALAESVSRSGAPGLPVFTSGMTLPNSQAESPPSILTVRELDVLRLLARGKSNKHVAADLTISEKTVETHRGRLMRKLRLRSIVELARYAIRHGVVEP